MKRSTISLATTAILVVMQVPANAQPTAHRLRPSQTSVQQETRFYIQGPNAPFQNQLRKMTDPLGANGAGR